MPSTRCCIHGRRGPPAADVGRRGASPVATALTRFLRQCNRHCCHSVATAHRVAQQRSAGSCDDATDSVANPLPQRITCCNSAQQVRVTTQPTLLPIRCSGHHGLQQRSVRQRRTAARERGLLQRRTACCNSVRLCCKQVDAPLVAAHCNGAACCNACCNAVQPAVAQPNLLQKAHGSSDAH